MLHHIVASDALLCSFPRQPCHVSSILNATCCRASTLAEFGTHQLEFWRLSQRTGNATYAQLAEATIRHLNKLAPNQVRRPGKEYTARIVGAHIWVGVVSAGGHTCYLCPA